jgi:hypothetical protein
MGTLVKKGKCSKVIFVAVIVLKYKNYKNDVYFLNRQKKNRHL